MSVRRVRARAVATLAALLSAMMLLTGCWHIVGVELMGLVPMIAVDAAPTGGYEVTVAVLNAAGLPPPGPSGTGGGGQGNSPVILRSTSAPSLDEAIHRLARSLFLQMDLTHLQAVLVSQAVAHSGLASALEYLGRSHVITRTGWLLVVRQGTARQLLEATRKDLPQPNEVLTETVSYGQQITPYYTRRLFTLFREAPLATTEFTTAGVVAGPSLSGSTTVPFKLAGQALFRRDRLVGWLDGGAALGLDIAMGHVRRQMLRVVIPSGYADLVLTGASPRVRVVARGAALPSIVLDLRVAAHLSDSTADLWSDAKRVADVEAAAGQAIRRDVQAAVRQAQSAHADVFGFGDDVRIRDAAYWARVGASWDSRAFPRLRVQVRVRVTLTVVGAALCPFSGRC